MAKYVNKIIFMTLTVFIGLSIGNASMCAEKKTETGVAKDSIYTDSRYGFSLQFPIDWKAAKLRKDPSAERIILVQKKPRVPVKLMRMPEAAQKPTIFIFADSCRMAPEAFFAFLKADTGRSDLKDKILSKSVFLERGTPNDIETIDSRQQPVAGRNAYRIRARLEYAVNVESQASADYSGENARGSAAPSLVRDFRAGVIYLIPFDGWIMYVEQVCENQFFESLMPAFDMAINSLKINPPAAEVTE